MVSVMLNCGECGASDGALINATTKSGLVDCVACGAFIDVGHAYRHSGWCVVCGGEPSECVCGGGGVSNLAPLLIDLERLSARLRGVSPEAAAMVHALWSEYADDGEVSE